MQSEFDPAVVQTGLLLALLANRIVEAIAQPIRLRWPQLSLWWLVYVSWLVGGALVFAAQLNLFAILFTGQAAFVGLILTAVTVGGGAGILSTGIDFFRGAGDALSMYSKNAQLKFNEASAAKKKEVIEQSVV